MATQTEQEFVKPVEVMTDVYVRVDPNVNTRYGPDYHRRHALALEYWIKEFEAFLLDHRSQDVNSMRVVRQIEDHCSGCGDKWEQEVDEDTGEYFCACCGASTGQRRS